MRTHSEPYYAPGGLTPEHFVARKRLLDLPGSRVVTPQGQEWNHRAIWNGGQGGPPAGSLVLAPGEEAPRDDLNAGEGA